MKKNTEKTTPISRYAIKYVNSFMSNGLEFSSDDEARAFLIDDIGLSAALTDVVMGFCANFRVDPYFQLDENLKPKRLLD